VGAIREIVLDTETTGFYADKGDRIVEIGAIELINHMPTEKYFHEYINPKRLVPEPAFKVHGLSYEFLKTKPVFEEIAKSFLQFIGDDKLIIHNAKFDIGFLNMELESVGKSKIDFNQTIDTLVLARTKFPGSPASLDALCRRFSIDNSKRELHGALLDSQILAEVYLELIGGRQPDLALSNTVRSNAEDELTFSVKKLTKRRPRKLDGRLTQDEIKAHLEFIKRINAEEKWS
jgi:DNA polymerase-3 subunit epsilon